MRYSSRAAWWVVGILAIVFVLPLIGYAWEMYREEFWRAVGWMIGGFVVAVLIGLIWRSCQ